MMKNVVTALAAALAMALVSGSATAQTTTTAPAKTTAAKPADAKPATTKAADPAKPARSELSLKCSAEATAKNLHGKERKKFRKECMKKKPS